MAYSSTNRPYLVAPAVAGGAQGSVKGGNIWVYRSEDPIGTVVGSYYFTDDIEGMQVNDVVIVIDTVTPTSTVCVVKTVSAAYGVTISVAGLLSGLGAAVTHDANWTILPEEAGRALYHSSASAHSWTIDSNANQPIPVGSVLTFTTGQSSGTLSILAGAGVTLERVDGTAGTGTRTMEAASKATAYQRALNTWELSGIFAS